MNNENKQLAVALASAIIQNLGNERYVDEKGNPIDVNIRHLLQSCYDAVEDLQ